MLLRRCTIATVQHLRWPATMKLTTGDNLHLPVKNTRWLHRTGLVQAPFTIAPLPERKFVRVQGSDSVSFLQGLMTNDMRHFEHSGAIYAMFLKANGRVFCDTLIYKRPLAVEKEQHDYLLECDATVAPRLERHLKLYRLRKKVQVGLDEEYRVWVAFKEEMANGEEGGPATNSPLYTIKDPRMPRLGYRVLSRADEANSKELLKSVFPDAGPIVDTSQPYTRFRYSLGIGEGEENLPDGKCFPLECNCDLLHGVSFHKGCYIGQELTARTYHTGVIRKRLMPLVFEIAPNLSGADPETLRDAEIKNGEGAVVGKLRGLTGDRGVGLLRIEKVQPGGQLTLNVAGVASPVPCSTGKPSWWPKEINSRV
ncbi:putative transferase CAF17 homolog, mitochondrial [Anopheles maculipalpis]|uniref:putative transferase CAF17 homolog, mitochondrial n=1 Tax=Anopheles maculipalpis TaxID=1496333 RepID=UPI002159A0B7|nr:putative transferase CAF17 homolog, mitochondrial [Anopheles maculipalpis]